jgi:4-hydroxy-tetrahydrodipicolinate reductase
MKILLIGASGRLGSQIDNAARLMQSSLTILHRTGGAKSGYPSDITPYLTEIDIVLDVSTPEALTVNLPKIVEARKPLVLGSTGHSSLNHEAIREAAKTIPLLFLANFSLGIATLKDLLQVLPKGECHITETHHTRKKDAPSGTALELLSYLPGDTKITSHRRDDEPATHKITLSLPFEEIEITHKVFDRSVFAIGALNACLFLLNKSSGLYTSFHDASR